MATRPRQAHRNYPTTCHCGAGRDQQKVSQSDLAAMAGIARENVSRALNDWANRSLVSRLAGYYCLENKAALNREAEG
jgi:CRP-like cAMP-binding protein